MKHADQQLISRGNGRISKQRLHGSDEKCQEDCIETDLQPDLKIDLRVDLRTSANLFYAKKAVNRKFRIRLSIQFTLVLARQIRLERKDHDGGTMLFTKKK
jgi:hypothetical protein